MFPDDADFFDIRIDTLDVLRQNLRSRKADCGSFRSTKNFNASSSVGFC